MPGYRFFAPAGVAQDKIWDDTVKQWVEAQAETYLRSLHAHLQGLCDNHLLWPPRLVGETCAECNLSA